MEKKIHYQGLSLEEKEKIEKQKKIHSHIMNVIGVTIYSFGIVWILQLCSLYSGGFTGVAQIIVGLFNKYGNGPVVTFFSNNLGTLILLLNIPGLVFSWKGLSKQFAILTLVNLILQTILINLLSMFTISPFVYFMGNSNQGILDLLSGGFRFFKSATETVDAVVIFQNTMTPGTRLVLAIMGGIVCGIGGGMCLKAGSSTGGMDIISSYLQVKKQIPFTKISGTFDSLVILASSIFSVQNVIYTLVRLGAYITTVDKIYASYKVARLDIVTTKVDEMRSALLENIKHSLTIYDSIGGYTMEKKNTIVVYASKFEIPKYTDIVKEVDPHAFISITHVKLVRSNYNQSTIV